MRPVTAQPGLRAYQQWREHKLRALEHPPRVIELGDPASITEPERQRLALELARHNLVVYVTAAVVDEDSIAQLAHALGLRSPDLDGRAPRSNGVSRLCVAEAGEGGEFIPYTDRALNWHTDGYYYPPQRRIRTFILHCLSPAAEGGVNDYFDHAVVYLRLRDQQPEWIDALSRCDAFTIPAHIEDGVELRAAVSGPVFSSGDDGPLHMRYTARQRSIEWANDPVLDEAREALQLMLEADDPCKRRVTPMAGQGVVCANVLHNRTRFEDREGETRLLLRARYHDAVAEL